MPYYDGRIVPAHGNSEATVFLINEAPGPCEAYYLIPSVGDQGGNLYRALQRAGIVWVQQIENLEKFKWPKLIQDQYKHPEEMKQIFELRDQVLAVRAKFIKCTNAFNQWPRSSYEACDTVDPAVADVLSSQNIDRLASEVPEQHKVILVCGAFAWLSCLGYPLSSPAMREHSRLSKDELQIINKRFKSDFSSGWYMGHTRRWSLDTEKTSRVLKEIAQNAGWPC